MNEPDRSDRSRLWRLLEATILNPDPWARLIATVLVVEGVYHVLRG